MDGVGEVYKDGTAVTRTTGSGLSLSRRLARFLSLTLMRSLFLTPGTTGLPGLLVWLRVGIEGGVRPACP